MVKERAEVYTAIDSERAYQEKKFGPAQEENSSIGDFILFMEHHLANARAAATTLDGRKPESRKAMLNFVRKVTALGVACMEVHGAPQREGHERVWNGCGECGGDLSSPANGVVPLANCPECHGTGCQWGSQGHACDCYLRNPVNKRGAK